MTEIQFYAVCLPPDYEDQETEKVDHFVFTEQREALQLVKKIKGSRFKVFKNEVDANKFVTQASEFTVQSPYRSLEDSKQDQQPSVESSPFKGPKPQEFTALKKVIEAGDVTKFRDSVWQNPRFLVSSGDTAAIYQAGPRYTAMHIAALKNQAEICQAILDLLEDKAFITLLYGVKMTEETINRRINFLVDLYLNMPDKGNCESPLHMACKFGFDKVVEVLTAHPRTDKQLINKYGDTPKQLICTRCSSAPVELKTKIETLLQGQYYVPLIRSEDNTSAAVIGQPWSPDVSNYPIEEVRVTNSPREPSMSVRACAGPMSPQQAGMFHKKWTTPPSHGSDKAREYYHTKRSDSEKGMERIGRKLAAELNIQWSEHWAFLDQFVDLASQNGLAALEDYLRKRIWLQFIRQFKDKFCIVDDCIDNLDSTLCSTPVSKKAKSRLFKDGKDFVDAAVDKIDENGLVGVEDKKDMNKPVRGDDKTQTSDKKENRNEVDRNGIIDNKQNTSAIKQANAVEQNDEERNSDIREDQNGNVSIASDIVSPMTKLAQKFEGLGLADDSWSEKATVASSDQSVSELCDEKVVIEELKDNSTDLIDTKTENDNLTETGQDKLTEKFEAENKTDIDGANVNTNNCSGVDKTESDQCADPQKLPVDKSIEDHSKGGRDVKNETDVTIDKHGKDENTIKDKNGKSEVDAVGKHNVDENATIDKIGRIEQGAKDKTTNNADEVDCSIKDKSSTECLDTKDVIDDTKDVIEPVKTHQRYRSTSTGSSDSFETADIASNVSNLSYCSLLSEDEDQSVCVRVYGGHVQSALREYCVKCDSTGKEGKGVNFVIQWKPYCIDSGQRVTLVSIPCLEVASEMVVFEDLVVTCTDGDMTGVKEGEVIDVRVVGDLPSNTGNSTTILRAYLTWTETLPKCGYIHGPQPTREDLDVARALSDTVITPDRYPNVFLWKLSLNRFLKDTNYRWQSPAKLKPKISQPSPLSPTVEELGSSQYVIQYGSPLGLKAPPTSTTYNTSPVKMKLFPAE